MKWQDEYKEKELIVFDLDGTLAESKMAPPKEVALALVKLLAKKEVAVISGSSFERFTEQFLKSLDIPEELMPRFYLFPTCATSFYRFENGDWANVYAEHLSADERKKIFSAFESAFEDSAFVPAEELYGDLIEDRKTQVSFSGLGQQAPVHLKKEWDPTAEKRQKIRAALLAYIPEFEVRIGGATTIDVTRKGIDKAYGIRKIEEILGIPKSKMLFIGDALFPGGNDYPVFEAGVDCIQVKDHEETRGIIEALHG